MVFLGVFGVFIRVFKLRHKNSHFVIARLHDKVASILILVRAKYGVCIGQKSYKEMRKGGGGLKLFLSPVLTKFISLVLG